MKKSLNIKGLVAAIALAAMSGGLLTSCNDTLDMPSYTKDDIDFAFKNEHNADLFVAGIYNGIMFEELYRQANTGETITIPNEAQLGGSKVALANYCYDPIAPFTFNSTYTEGYKRIEACNLAMKRLKGMEQTDKVKALIAEVAVLRGLVYSNIIKVFGDVPFNTKPLEDQDPESTEVMYPKRVSRDIIYDYVIDEIAATVDDLPWQSEAGYTERLTRNSAKGILARICLLAGGFSLRWDLETNDVASLKMEQREDTRRIREIYEIADAALNDVITQNENYLIQADSEMNGFYRLFYHFMQRRYDVTNPEIMWSIAQLGPTENSNFGINQGQPGATQATIYGQRKAMQLRLPTYYLSFDEKDVRRDVSCGNYSVTTIDQSENAQVINVGTTYASVTPAKFRMQWAVEPEATSKRNVNIPMLRYSDILLMYAETQNYLFHGPTGPARDALQKVRERAGVGHLPMAGDELGFLEDICQERKWEFADEFMLRFDLIRMNLLDKNIREAQQDLKDLTKREGKYSGIATYRLYKLTNDENQYGTKFLTLDYVDVTDQAEINQIMSAPKNTAAARKEFSEKCAAIAAAHGKDGNATWYAINMFQSWNSTYNKASRFSAGFKPSGAATLGMETTICDSSFGYKENGDAYPAWVEGDWGLYSGYVHNRSELSPFAANGPGKPIVDNPNLTQLPGYVGYTAPTE